MKFDKHIRLNKSCLWAKQAYLLFLAEAAEVVTLSKKWT